MALMEMNIKPLLITDEQFYLLCQANPDLRIERSATGELIIMPPTGGDGDARSLSVGAQLWIWNEQSQLGIAFDSSTGFRLPNGADRSPDAAWVAKDRWDKLSPEQRRQFPPLCPDFVIEVRSASDDLKPIQNKMNEYITNGAKLGWLIDPSNRCIEVYEPDEEVEILYNPTYISADPILPKFRLNLSRVW